MKCFWSSKTHFIDILSTKLKKIEIFTKSSHFHALYCYFGLSGLRKMLSCRMKVACGQSRGAVKKLKLPTTSKKFLKTLWVMHHNILEPQKLWTSPHVCRARQVWHSHSPLTTIISQNHGFGTKIGVSRVIFWKNVFFPLSILYSQRIVVGV